MLWWVKKSGPMSLSRGKRALTLISTHGSWHMPRPQNDKKKIEAQSLHDTHAQMGLQSKRRTAELGMVACAYNSKIWKLEPGGSGVQGQHWHVYTQGSRPGWATCNSLENRTKLHVDDLPCGFSEPIAQPNRS